MFLFFFLSIQYALKLTSVVVNKSFNTEGIIILLLLIVVVIVVTCNCGSDIVTVVTSFDNKKIRR